MSILQSKVLVIGGGIAGIQTSLDLTELGFKVYLVEKSPTIGGHMAQLDKTFPTLDCSLCILSPKMVQVHRDPNIELLTYSYVDSINGIAGNYKVKVVKKPRYIKEDICKGCGNCAEVCPQKKILDEFDENLKYRKAVYIPFPSAVPPVYLIDENKCLHINYNSCGFCLEKCTTNAIDFSQKPEEINLSVGAIVIATGFVQNSPEMFTQLKGTSQNVISSLQFERLLSANGPTSGELIRLSDKKHLEKIAFVQCVCSRNYHHPECNKYCSSVCCMVAAKQAIVTKEHNPNVECSIYNTELRTKGKNFYEFILKSKEEYGVKFINGKVTFIKENQNKDKLLLSYENIDNKTVETDEVDLVVLAISLHPDDSYYNLLKNFNCKINEFGYLTEEEVKKLKTQNIFLAGFARNPKDIPCSVAEGSSCAASISEKLASVRFRDIVEKEYPPEKPIAIGAKPRVGILVCQCGINIAGVVNTKKVVEYVSKLPYVIHAEDNMYSCSPDSQERIKEIIKEYSLNRFIVASCTPRTHEPLFQNTLREAGLNPFLFELVNIRDQDSWVHSHDPNKATTKACDLIRMYLAKVINLKPLKKLKVKVEQSTLIIGGGISGIIAAKNLANQGFNVYIIEIQPTLGGKLAEFDEFYDTNITKKAIINYIDDLKIKPNVHIFTNSIIEDIYGYVGNYQIKIHNIDEKLKIEEFKVGTIIVATGFRQAKTKRWSDLQEKYRKKILTQYEFELLKDINIPKFNDVAIILCVDQRANEENQGEEVKTYCSNICCKVALKNIEKLLKINPNAHIHVLYREMQFSDLKSEYLWRQLRKYVLFERYHSINKININDIDNNIHIKYNNIEADTDIEYNTDLLILATPSIPNEGAEELAKMLKVPTTKDGFFLEAHVKLRPLDFATEGIFLCGGAHWPKTIDESIIQAYGASGRAAMIMVKGEIETAGITSYINVEKCIGCGRCVEVCPYNAIELTEIIKEMGLYNVTEKKAHILDVVCKGCGACVAECPVGAINQNHFSTFQIIKQIDLLPKIKLKASEKN